MAERANVPFSCGLSVPPLSIPSTQACKRVRDGAGSVESGKHEEGVR